MAYIRHEFKSGEKLYASQLNEMDEQIYKNESEIIELKANSTQSETLFGESVEWLNANGDITKPYILPDGYIYAWQKKKVTIPHNANDGTGFKNVRPTGKSGSNKDETTTKNGLFTTAPIEVDNSWTKCVVNISGLEKIVPTFYASLYVYYFDANGTFIAYDYDTQLYNADGTRLTTGSEVDIPLPISINIARANINGEKRFSTAKFVRVTIGVHKTAAITDADIKNLVVNFEQLNVEEDVYGWHSTGVKYSQDDYSEAIDALQADVETLKEAVQKSPSNSGANWYALGDSITYGLYSTSLTDYHQPVIGQRWVDYVAKYNGYTLTNLGKSGSGFVTGTTFRTIVDGNDFSNVDLVTIMLGINDWKNELAVNKVGSMEDDIATGGTIVSELRYGIEKIISENPYCKIIYITPINAKIVSRGTEDTNWAYGYTGTITPCGSLKNFTDKLKEVCEYYGIQVIDMTNSSVVNRKSITTVLPDGIHPNLECYKVLGQELARKITFA